MSQRRDAFALLLSLLLSLPLPLLLSLPLPLLPPLAGCGRRTPVSSGDAAPGDAPADQLTVTRKDAGVVISDYSTGYEAGWWLDSGPRWQDVGPFWLDTGAPPAKLGALCDAATPCQNPGEQCLQLSPSASKGMCLTQCSQPGAQCPVNDKATQLSMCVLKAQGRAKYFCAFLCQYQGQSYSCPDATSYTCWDPASTQVKVCMPK